MPIVGAADTHCGQAAHVLGPDAIRGIASGPWGKWAAQPNAEPKKGISSKYIALVSGISQFGFTSLGVSRCAVSHAFAFYQYSLDCILYIVVYNNYNIILHYMLQTKHVMSHITYYILYIAYGIVHIVGRLQCTTCDRRCMMYCILHLIYEVLYIRY